MSSHLLLRRLRRAAAVAGPEDDAVPVVSPPPVEDKPYYDDDDYYYIYIEGIETGTTEGPEEEKENPINKIVKQVADIMHGKCRDRNIAPFPLSDTSRSLCTPLVRNTASRYFSERLRQSAQLLQAILSVRLSDTLVIHA